MPGPPASHRSGGLPMAIGAHLVWGLLPLYLMLVSHVPAFEFVGWRVVFTVPLCLAFVVMLKQGSELRAALGDRKVLARLLFSALLVGSNWLVYVAAIQAGQVYAASFGYYITPLFQVAAGTLFLGEKLSRNQWGAVALATIGVALLGWGGLHDLWISLALALTWGAYGLIRKLTAVGSLPGLTVETLLLLPVGLAITWWYAQSPSGTSLTGSAGNILLIAASGLFTATPLLLFAIAARRMDFSAIGMIQFLSPTIVFALGVLAFGKPLHGFQVAAFVIIWVAIALFVWDLLARSKAAS